MKGVVEAGSCREGVWAAECSGAGGGFFQSYCCRGKAGSGEIGLEEEGGRDL